MARFILIEILAISAVVVLASTTSDTVICVSKESVGSEDQLNLECGNVSGSAAIICSSAECISGNATDSTLIQFVSQEFELKRSLTIKDRKDIQLVGSSSHENKTRIVCHKQSMEYQKDIGIAFNNITNLTISNIAVEKCDYFWRKEQHNFWSAVYLFHCTDVTITNISIVQSVGNGLAIINSNGTVTVEDSDFENNGIKRDTMNELVPGAGGLHIEFAYCTTDSHGDCETPQLWSTNSCYNIINCMFSQNNVYYESTDGGHTWDSAPLGGGLGILLREKATGNNIMVSGCKFCSNTAVYGGGMNAMIINLAQNNTLVVRDSRFEGNQSPRRGGGGVSLGHIFTSKEAPKGNQIIFENTKFVNNSAAFGGGLAIHSSPNVESGVFNNTFVFRNCSWEENEAYFAAAVDLSMHKIFLDSSPSSATFIDCTFLNNIITYNKSKLGQSAKQYLEGHGVFLSTAYTIQFEGNTTFCGNSGTALFMVTSTARFGPDSVVLFQNNSGSLGAAITLAGLSTIVVQQNSNFTFRQNRASSSGAAIYQFSIDQHELFAGSTNCFIKHLGSNEESIHFKFEDNNIYIFENHTDGDSGHDIHAVTLNQCKRMCNANNSDPTTIFKCVGQFSFSNKSVSTVTLGAKYTMEKSNISHEVIPGAEFQIPFDLKDDLGNKPRTVYRVSVNNTNVIIHPMYIADGQFKVYGMPGHSARLTLTKKGGVRPMTVVFTISLKHCPPGFVIETITHSWTSKQWPQCVCAVNTGKSYQGIAWCNSTHYYAYAKRGTWFGYEDYNLYTAHCPSDYCSIDNSNGTYNPQIYPLITEASPERLDEVICATKRTGILCGKCISHHSVSFHNYGLKCEPDDKCRLGWLLYITAELLPLTLLFLVVIFFNISFTTGTASGFIFFAQVIDSFVVTSHGSVWLRKEIFKLTEVYRFIYRFFNFDFFSNQKLGFCLIKGATALDILAFKYVTILYALIMIFAMIFILNYCSAYFYRKYSCIMKHTLKSSVIHGLSAFLIMCYTQCIRVSFLLLTPATIYGRGGKVSRRVVFRDGEIDYFSEAHLRYAIPAIAFITIALIPPLLLIVYPLHYRVIAALKLDEKRWFKTVSKYDSLEKMKPLLDSFQSCFKDNCRFFAGLYFLYRFLFLLSFAVIESYTSFYTVIEVQLIAILALHAHVQPYQNKLHNRLDTLIFTNLAVINAISVLNYSYVSRATFSNYMFVHIIDAFSAIQLALIFLPLGILAGYIVYSLLLKLRVQLKKRYEKMEEETDGLEMPARLVYSDEESDESDDYHLHDESGHMSD